VGAWGVKAFENDTALDWISELEDEKDLLIVVEKFLDLYRENNKKKNIVIEDDLSWEVLAAAEIVAALLRAPGDSLPPSMAKWLNKKTYDRGLVSYFKDVMSADETDKSTWKEMTNEHKWNEILSRLSECAKELIDIILEKSELKEHWESSDNYENWLNEINNLKNRCSINDN